MSIIRLWVLRLATFIDDLIAVSILLIVFVGLYLKSTGKTLKELFEELKEAF